MNIEKIEKSKIKIDWAIIIIFILWIGARVVSIRNIEPMEEFLFLFHIFLILGGLYLLIQYVYFNLKLTDEFELANKQMAHKFSWNATLISAIILLVLSTKGKITGTFSIELLLWIGYLSYFIAYKYLDAGLNNLISPKILKSINKVAGFIFIFFLGLNLGFTSPDFNLEHFNDNKLIYIFTLLFLVILSVLLIIRFIALTKLEEKKS